MTRTAAAASLIAIIAASDASAWDCHGHRTITHLAQEGLARRVSELPAWLTAQRSRDIAAYQSCEPDRYRALRSPYMGHENNLEHYLDIEDLEPFGLTIDTVPPLRYEYLRALAIGKHEHPEGLGGGFKPYNPKTDPTRTMEWPGFGPHAVLEHYFKLVSGLRTVRTLERLSDPARDFQLEAARANVLMEMGHLAHFVGDLAQPLHTTTHHHGWVGDNPAGYTTDRGIHAHIDGTILDIHGLDADAVRPACDFSETVDRDDPWRDVIAHIKRSFEQVEPLYAMEKSGELAGDAGKRLITARLADGAETLAALYAAAWQASEPTDKDPADFVKYDRFEGTRPAGTNGPAKSTP